MKTVLVLLCLLVSAPAFAQGVDCVALKAACNAGNCNGWEKALEEGLCL